MPDQKKKYRSPEEAALWAREQNVTSETQWRQRRKADPNWLPDDIPNSPHSAYAEAFKKNGGWGWFLGTGRVATQVAKQGFVSLPEAALWARSQGIVSYEHWREKVLEPGWRPAFIPSNIADAYGSEAFNAMGGWPGFLGLPAQAARSKVERIVQYVLCDVFGNLHLDDHIRVKGKSGKGWMVDAMASPQRLIVEYDGERYHRDRLNVDREKTEDLVGDGWFVIRMRGGQLPLLQEPWDIQVNERHTPHAHVRQLLEHLLKLDEAGAFVLSERAKIRSVEWIGEKLTRFNFRDVLAQWDGKVGLEEAMAWAQEQGVKTQAQWRAIEKPSHIPANPDQFYGEAFPGFGVFLGTGRVANQNREFGSLEEVMAWAKSEGVTSKSQWFLRMKQDKPTWIPTDPAGHYDKDWVGWSAFFGKRVVTGTIGAPLKSSVGSVLRL